MWSAILVKEDFPKALIGSSSGILIMYLMVTIAMYLVYGCSVPADVLYVLPDGTSKRVAAACVFVHVCISYVMAQQVVGRAIHVRLAPTDVDSSTKREYVC